MTSTKMFRCPTPAITLLASLILVSATVAHAAPNLGCFPQRLLAFSKDICDGTIGDGQASIFVCNDGFTTLCVKNATWVIPLNTNPQSCSDCGGLTGRCDETREEKDGVIKVTTNFNLRVNEPCRFRGCWNGRWEFEARDGTVYFGNAMGTFGAGTHRAFSCSGAEGSLPRACEDCYDVEFIPLTAFFGIWRVGVEGAFLGCDRSSTDPPGETLCFTLSGDLVAFGTCDAGPFDPNSFRFFGTADGTLGQRCVGFSPAE